MNKSTLLIATALSGALALTACKEKETSEAPAVEKEKCYGVAKAGKNDCAAQGVNSCAGTQETDGDPHGWIYAPKGLCDKLVNGSTKTPES